MKTSVLLVEEDSSLVLVMQNNLQEAGFNVTAFGNGEEALERFPQNKFNICILAINLPVMDGFTLAKKIREADELIPIIFLSANHREENKLKGFVQGSDSYLLKPFSIKELILQMEVLLGRTKNVEINDQGEFVIGKFTFKYNEQKLYYHNQVINLTQKEAALLNYLVQNSNKILKREEVLLNVWGKDDYFLGRSMDVFITKLRKHLKADPNINLETIHGIGFRFNT